MELVGIYIVRGWALEVWTVMMFGGPFGIVVIFPFVIPRVLFDHYLVVLVSWVHPICLLLKKDLIYIIYNY